MIRYDSISRQFFYLTTKEQSETTFEERRRLNYDFCDFFNY